MTKPTQLPLALWFPPAQSRDSFIVSSANSEAFAFIESWPDWTVAIAALYGPPGCGKSHLASIWQAMSGARRISANELNPAIANAHAPIVIEDIDTAEPTHDRDSTLFALMQKAQPDRSLLVTGIGAPGDWRCVLPDLASRFSALAAIRLWPPDEALLAGLARKLFADRQLSVPEEVIEHMLHVLERSPEAVRDFVAQADAVALAETRPVSVSLVRALLAAHRGGS